MENFEQKTWDNLEAGDVLIDNNGDEYSVLGICGRVILLSDADCHDETGPIYTKEELIADGYKIKGASEDKPSIDNVISAVNTFCEQELSYNEAEQMDKILKMLKKIKGE